MKSAVVPVTFEWNVNFLDRFSKTNTQVSNLMTIRPVGAELFYADRRTYIHDDANKRLCSFAKAPTNQYNPRQGPHYCTLCWDQCEGM
jgi:hypothetical protein